MQTEFKNYLKLNVNSSNTVNKYSKIMILFFKKYTEFSQENINKYLTSLIDDKISSSTFNVRLCAFKQYDTFKDTKIMFPKQRKVARTIKPSLSRDEIENEILPYFDSIFQDSEKRKLVFRFMMLTMLRISEVITLKIKDIDFKSHRINVIGGKGGKNRVTFLHKSITDDLQKEIINSNRENVFNIKQGYIEYMFLQIKQNLNYKKNITPHTLRHAGALHFYETTHDMKGLQEILGHESIATTENYIRGYQLNKIQEQYNKMEYKKG